MKGFNPKGKSTHLSKKYLSSQPSSKMLRHGPRDDLSHGRGERLALAARQSKLRAHRQEPGDGAQPRALGLFEGCLDLRNCQVRAGVGEQRQHPFAEIAEARSLIFGH